MLGAPDFSCASDVKFEGQARFRSATRPDTTKSIERQRGQSAEV